MDEGGLNLLNIKAQNEAIELTWLRSYLDLTPKRPMWAIVTDILISASAPPGTLAIARMNMFIQKCKSKTPIMVPTRNTSKTPQKCSDEVPPKKAQSIHGSRTDQTSKQSSSSESQPGPHTLWALSNVKQIFMLIL